MSVPLVVALAGFPRVLMFLGCGWGEGYGGHSVGETPGPIPNPEAKPTSADGTALVTVWESRTPPDIHCEEGQELGFEFLALFAFSWFAACLSRVADVGCP